MSLYTGKLDHRLEISVTEAFYEAFSACAHTLGIPKGDLARDMLTLGFTGETHSFHVAKDKDIATKALLEKFRKSLGNDSGLL
jgi:hypothetical protein